MMRHLRGTHILHLNFRRICTLSEEIIPLNPYSRERERETYTKMNKEHEEEDRNK